ncbi:MAG: disulfide oxidoreductase [Dehalococcoidia bacterium]
MLDLIADHGPKFALLVALTATLGSLYFSEIRDYIPCELCWFQRILMYPLVVIILVGILTRDYRLPAYVLPLSLLGFGVSTYHYLLQNAFVHNSGFCSAGVSCSHRWINYFGFVTIPFLAQVAFALIILTIFASILAGAFAHEDE